MDLTQRGDVPAQEVTVELSMAYVMPDYKSESIIGSKDALRPMSPEGESRKREYCVPHHCVCHHKQKSRLTLLDLHFG